MNMRTGGSWVASFSWICLHWHGSISLRSLPTTIVLRHQFMGQGSFICTGMLRSWCLTTPDSSSSSNVSVIYVTLAFYPVSMILFLSLYFLPHTVHFWLTHQHHCKTSVVTLSKPLKIDTEENTSTSLFERDIVLRNTAVSQHWTSWTQA